MQNLLAAKAKAKHFWCPKCFCSFLVGCNIHCNVGQCHSRVYCGPVDSSRISNSSPHKNASYLGLEIVLPPSTFKTTNILQQKHLNTQPQMRLNFRLVWEAAAAPHMYHPTTTTRASNEGSQRFYNHGKGPPRVVSWLKVTTSTFPI